MLTAKKIQRSRRGRPPEHGLSSPNSYSRRLYDVWRQMMRRCYDRRCKDFPAYGRRGISVCKQWRDVRTFVRWAWRSGYDFGLTMERRSFNGHYNPRNCTWVPNPLQGQNTRKARLYTFNGRTLHLSGWARFTGIHVQTLLLRRRNGWSVAAMLTTPPRRGRNQFSAPPC